MAYPAIDPYLRLLPELKRGPSGAVNVRYDATGELLGYTIFNASRHGLGEAL